MSPLNWFVRRTPSLNLPQTWKAIAELPLDGDQQIVPAKVGVIQPLKAQRQPSIIDRFRKARAR